MKSLFTPVKFLFLATVAVFTLPGCMKTINGEGPETVQNKEVSNFTELVLDIPANITVVIADSVKCVINAQKNIADNIEFNMRGDKLEIDSKENFNTEKPVEIIISVPSITKISVNGSGNLQTLNSIKGENLKLIINGSGNIKANCEVTELISKINGSGNLILSGKASSHESEINGSGNLKSFDFSVDDYKINVKGSGDAEITANTSLDARLIGSGNINYNGSPQIKSEITGSGEISKK